MANLENTPNFSKFSNSELLERLNKAPNYHEAVSIMTELTKRSEERISALETEVKLLRLSLIHRQSGRRPYTRKEFIFNEMPLTDSKLIELIDGDYDLTFSKIAKSVGATPNQLRNRYKRAKEQNNS